MIIAHLADLHLGYRAYSRTTRSGVNQREADVAAAFDAVVRAVVEESPDLIVVAGDVFHSVRPSNAAIAHAFRRFSELSSRLPQTPVVIVAGDRDTPRSADSTSILELFREIPRVQVATRATERFPFAELGVEVVALPHAAVPGLSPSPRLRPRATAAIQILVAHAALTGVEVEGRLPAPSSDGGAALPAEALRFDEWDYIALGHHPVAAELASNVWYAGSIERTSTDIWAEAEIPKGFVVYDTALGTGRLHAVATRTVTDLPRVSARGMEREQLRAAIDSVLREVPGGIAGRIARLVVTDVTRADLRTLDTGVLREARASALHFLLDARTAAPDSLRAAAMTVRGVSLERQVEEYLERVWEPTMHGIERDRLVALARSYLSAVAEGVES